MLNENEYLLIYEMLQRAELSELVALSSLVQGFTEASVKESQEGLALLLDKHNKNGKVEK